MDILEKTLFPFSRIREEQRSMLEGVVDVMEKGGSLLANAPTGIGKTAASLPPALAYGLENGKTVFFLTPKHSHHHIVVETLKKMKRRYGKDVVSVDIIGKQWTCLYEGARDLISKEFNQFCQSHKRNETCRFHNSVYKDGSRNLSDKARKAIREIKSRSPLHSEGVLEICKEYGLCPYEISVLVGRSADVVVCDYYHVFHPRVRTAFLGRMDRELEDMILIVDEAHNLPERVRSLMSHNLSEYTVSQAVKEARALREENLEEDLMSIVDVLKSLGKGMKGGEMFVKKEDFTGAIEKAISMDAKPFVDDLEAFAERVLELPNRYRSYCSSIAGFLREWTGDKNEAAYARILQTYTSRSGRRYQISIKCLDPGIYTEELFSKAHASVLMSGTLLPLEMYETVLGIHDARLEQFSNPFPKENRLVLLTSGMTTKYTKRSPHMWDKISRTLSRIISDVPGNTAVFFPSYRILDNISLKVDTGKKVKLVEKQSMKKRQRHELYRRLAKLSEGEGGVLFAVQAGSFSEGMDFPGKMLNCVAVVGLPLEKPTLETEALINYYDFKFERGWDYGYIYPAMNRALQAAGRCIRSETDRGAIILMDDRFNWGNYKKCFPRDMRFIITSKPKMYVEKFFKAI